MCFAVSDVGRSSWYPGKAGILKNSSSKLLLDFVLFYSVPFHSILCTNVFQKGLNVAHDIITEWQERLNVNSVTEIKKKKR
jgi:hypothetical protein